jgi:hypothetical protein
VDATECDTTEFNTQYDRGVAKNAETDAEEEKQSIFSASVSAVVFLRLRQNQPLV